MLSSMKCFTRLYGSYGIGKVGAFAVFVIVGVLMTWRYGASIYWRNNSMKLNEEAIIGNEKVDVLFKSCLHQSPRKNIAFAYTHSTEGAIVQSVILRQAHALNLTVVLPVSSGRTHLGSYPEPLKPSNFQSLKPNYTYNVLAHHARWNHSVVQEVLPSDTVYVTFLQDPVLHFPLLNASHNLSDFWPVGDSNATYNNKFGFNKMAFDLGLNLTAIRNNASAILRAAVELDRQFRLVVLADQLEESLILLKDLMCWSMDDVVSLSLHVAPIGSAAKAQLPDSKWQESVAVDRILYDYYGTRLRARIVEFGVERMARERALLADRIHFWREFCLMEPSKTEILNTTSQQGASFRLRKDQRNATCVDLTRTATQLTEALRQKQAGLFL